MVDDRLAEASASSIGVETPITYGLAIRTSAILWVVGLTSLISGYALGTSAFPTLSWFTFYSVMLGLEGKDKNTNNPDRAGTSLRYDLRNHIVQSLYSFVGLAAIAAGGWYFGYQFIGLDDGFTCDLQENVVSAATYAGIQPILAAMSDRKSCLETIQKVFDIEDLDNNGTISRCEDATLQHAFGSSKSYSFKYSSPFTRDAFNKICYENFAS